MKPSFAEFIGKVGAGEYQSLIFDHVQREATLDPKPIDWTHKISIRSDKSGPQR